MAARVLHFGQEPCEVLPVLRSAGYTVESCSSVLQLRVNLEAGCESDAVSMTDGLVNGTFELDLEGEELRRNGLKLKLTGQPFQVLAILLEHPISKPISRARIRSCASPFQAVSRSV